MAAGAAVVAVTAGAAVSAVASSTISGRTPRGPEASGVARRWMLSRRCGGLTASGRGLLNGPTGVTKDPDPLIP